MSRRLADKILVLRDEVLDTAGLEEDGSPGTEVFDAIVSRLAADSGEEVGLDLSLHEALSRRLAWGESEAAVLADADQVVCRLTTAAQRSFRDLRDETEAVRATTGVGMAASRIIALAAAGRAARERAGLRREEAKHERLAEALRRQETLVAELEAELKALSDKP